MGEGIKLTGGARIGFSNVSWPFATLKVSKDKLILNASIVGKLVFQPKEVISIETYKVFPLIGQGIRIYHRVENYKQKVIFWTFDNPSKLLEKIKKTGFLDTVGTASSDTGEAIVRVKDSPFPIKKSVAIGVVIFWNLFILYDIMNFAAMDGEGSPFGIGIMLAVGGLFLMSLLLLISEDFGKYILKEGRSVEDIKSFVYLLLLVSGFMLFGAASIFFYLN